MTQALLPVLFEARHILAWERTQFEAQFAKNSLAKWPK